MGNLKKEIELQMKQDEAMGKFEEQIATLEKKKQGLIELAAQAELNGDTASYELAADNILYIQDAISSMRQNKMNMDIIAMTGDITLALNAAFAAMETMAKGNVALPNFKKIMATQAKLGEYMKEASAGQKMMRGMMKSSNPAPRTARSVEEREGVKAMIAAERSRMVGHVSSSSSASLADEIERERRSEFK